MHTENIRIRIFRHLLTKTDKGVNISTLYSSAKTFIKETASSCQKKRTDPRGSSLDNDTLYFILRSTEALKVVREL